MWRCEARRLSWDQGGVCLEVLDEDEAVFLFHEIVVRDLYCQHGIRVGRGSLVVDVVRGARPLASARDRAH